MTRRPRGIPTEELVREFFLATERLPREEAAGIAGVCLGTLNRWERSAPRQVKLAVRLRLLEYLADSERLPPEGEAILPERRIPLVLGGPVVGERRREREPSLAGAD